MVAIATSSVLADGAVLTAGAGLIALLRRLWPVRRKATGPVAAVVTGLVALALAITGRRVQTEVAEVMLAAVVAGWLIATGGYAWSRVQTAGWSALRPRRKAPVAALHPYIWVDAVITAVATAFIVRRDLQSVAEGVIAAVVPAIIGSARLSRMRRDGTVAIRNESRRAMSRWPRSPN